MSTVERFIVSFKTKKRRWPDYNDYMSEPCRPFLRGTDFNQVVRSMQTESQKKASM